MPTSQAELTRLLSIKTNVVKRYTKEVKSYENEISRQSLKIKTMTENNCCPHELKNQTAVLHESEAMLPGIKEKLEISIRDLRDFLKRHQADEFELDVYREASNVVEVH